MIFFCIDRVLIGQMPFTFYRMCTVGLIIDLLSDDDGAGHPSSLKRVPAETWSTKIVTNCYVFVDE